MSETLPMNIAASDAPAATSLAASFEAFFGQQREDLFRAPWLVTRSSYEAEELTQDAFVRVLERWDRVSSMDDPRGYLYRTAMNAFRSSFARAVLVSRRTMGMVPPDDAIAQVDERDAAVRALASLSPRQRASVVLTDLLGFRSEEAARMLGIRASTLGMHASRARALLKESMSRD